MSGVLRVARQVAGLFFDDGRLAITVLLVLGLTAALAYARPLDAPAAGAILVCGVVAALLENVARSARAARSGN